MPKVEQRKVATIERRHGQRIEIIDNATGKRAALTVRLGRKPKLVVNFPDDWTVRKIDTPHDDRNLDDLEG